LRASALDHYGIKIGMSEQDGKTPCFHYYPYTKGGEVVGYKVRHIETKNMWCVGDQRDVDLFGWDQAVASGTKRLIITEGELDAVALTRILEIYTKADFKDYIPAVCSLPHGAASARKDVTRLLPEIRRHFKDISLCFDDDEAGKKATEDVCKVMPDATVINLPDKDANACLVNGKGKAAHKAVTFNTAKAKNTSLVFGEDLHTKAREPAVYGQLTWPWEHVQEATRGIRYGETIYIGAGVKMGKSEMLNALGAHFIKGHGVKIFMAKPEEANNKTYKLMAGKIVGKVFHDPNVESLKADIYSAAGWGAKVVFIDPITNLINGLAAAEANTLLQEIAQELAAIAKDLDIVVFIFCHLKAPTSGEDHEHGGDVLSSQFAGSRAMMRSCNYMLGIKGNKSPDLELTERNMRTLVLLEDREFGQTGEHGLYWDYHTGLFNEV